MKMIPESWPPVEWRLGPAAVHLWTSSLDASPADLSALKKTLSPQEMKRAQQFRFEKDRNRFIAGRGLVRSLLGRYLQLRPADLEFAEGPHGKPFLSGALAESRLHFNLAHSENRVLIGLTRVGIIGVDIERIRPLDGVDELVGRFFSTREKSAFQKLPPKRRSAAFFRLWTRKEAWLKGTGEGLGQLSKVAEVSFLPTKPEQSIILPDDRQSGACWIVQDLKSSRGFAAAMAIYTPHAASLSCHCWNEKSGNCFIHI